MRRADHNLLLQVCSLGPLAVPSLDPLPKVTKVGFGPVEGTGDTGVAWTCHIARWGQTRFYHGGCPREPEVLMALKAAEAKVLST